MKFKTGSICSKHNEIEELAEKIADLAQKCLDDGGRMEDGLIEKNKRIDKLESEVEDLKEELRSAEKLIEGLQEENRDLATELKDLSVGA